MTLRLALYVSGRMARFAIELVLVWLVIGFLITAWGTIGPFPIYYLQ